MFVKIHWKDLQPSCSLHSFIHPETYTYWIQSIMTNMLETDSLLCTEVLSNLVTPQKEILAHKKPVQIIEVPLTVQAEEDPAQLNDVRVLQNLLRNEDNYGLTVPDYIVNVQVRKSILNVKREKIIWNFSNRKKV